MACEEQDRLVCMGFRLEKLFVLLSLLPLVHEAGPVLSCSPRADGSPPEYKVFTVW